MKKLYRHRNSEIAGVCSGLGKYFDIDESIFRLLFLVGIFSPLPAILTYLLFWVVIPKEPKI
jgi:phage shock protein PspC (stress-responsive transcriptional regulator)